MPEITISHGALPGTVSPSAHGRVSGGEIYERNSSPSGLHTPAKTNPRPDSSSGNGEITGPQRKILRALAELRSIGKEQAPRDMVAAWAGYSPNSGGFNNPMGNLNSLGLVRYPSEGFVSLTDEGLAVIGEMPAPDQQEVHRRILDILDGPQRKILAALMEHGTEPIGRTRLAEESGYSPESGGFNNPVGSLRTKGFVEYPAEKQVKCADWLFAE